MLRALFLLLLTAAPADPAHEALMRRIEALVVMPPGAQPLRDYGRHYAFVAPGRVRATYLLPLPPPAGPCEQVGLDHVFRPCPAKVWADIQARYRRAAAVRAGAGERRWFDDPKALPFIFDGGCTQVTVEFYVATAQVLRAACNGLA